MIKKLFPYKLCIVIPIILFTTQMSYSQKSVTIGLKTGTIFNQNIIAGESIANYSNGFNKTGFVFGVSSGLDISKYFSVLADADYLSRGMNYNQYKSSANTSNPMARYLS